MVAGELVLVEEQEVILRAGDAAGWQAGAPHAHCLENRSSRSATVLIVGTRAPEETVHYLDQDAVLRRDVSGARLTKEDGSPFARKV